MPAFSCGHIFKRIYDTGKISSGKVSKAMELGNEILFQHYHEKVSRQGQNVL